MDLNELADRVEALAGPDRKVDCAIYQANNPHMLPVKGSIGRFYDPAKTSAMAAEKYHISGGATGFAPAYTASIDAAMTLAEGFGGRVTFFKNGTAKAFLWKPYPMGVETKAATPAIALTAAALRTKALGAVHTLEGGL